MSPRNLIIFSFLLLITVNVVLLDLIVFSRLPQRQEAAVVTLVAPPDTCPLSCRSVISEELAKQKTEVIFQPQAKISPAVSFPLSAKEYYIPLGSGVTKSSDYEELTSVEAYVDTKNYPPIAQAYFGTHLRNPTGNGMVYAKLYNATDKHDVWFSDVSFEGGGTLQREAKITLDPGRKLYRVMIKSTLRYDGYVDNARIRIVTQ
jgi:hypothetical protein